MDAKVLIILALAALTFTPAFKRLFPWVLHIQWNEIHGWRCWVDRG